MAKLGVGATDALHTRRSVGHIRGEAHARSALLCSPCASRVGVLAPTPASQDLLRPTAVPLTRLDRHDYRRPTSGCTVTTRIGPGAIPRSAFASSTIRRASRSRALAS